VRRAEETNKILEYTSQLAKEAGEQTKQGVKEAEISSKQNRSLMIFTIVTIIFVTDLAPALVSADFNSCLSDSFPLSLV